MDYNKLKGKRERLERDQAKLSEIISKIKGQIETLEETLTLRERDLYATNGAINVIDQLINEDSGPQIGPVNRVPNKPAPEPVNKEAKKE